MAETEHPWWDRVPPERAPEFLYLDDEALERALGALLYYVDEWKLSLNPEDLQEMAGAAVLAYMGIQPRPTS